MLSFLKCASILLAACLFLGHDLAFLHAQAAEPERTPSQVQGGFRIAGTVVNATTTQPIARAQVSVTNTKNPKDSQSIVTSDDGRFRFQVNAGKYSLRAARQGFITSAYDQHENFWTGIVTGAGLDTENLALRLPPAAVLTGKVTDDVGDPVRNAAVMVFREDHRTGETRIQEFSRVSTDDLGVYELTPLDAGIYFVAVSAQPWYAVHPVSPLPGAEISGVDRTLDVAFPTAYYKDVTESDDATPIPIRRGDHVEVDIHLNPVPALHLFFNAPDGYKLRFVPPVFQKSSFDGPPVDEPSSVEQVSPGVYEVTGLAAGKYILQTRGPWDGRLKAPSDVYLNEDGQELDVSGGAPTASVKATVQLRGSAKLPAQLSLALRNNKNAVVAGSLVQVNEKGEAEFTDIAPGKYDVVAGSPTRSFSISRITSGGQATSGHVLNVPAGSSLNISLSLVGGAVTVEGFAKRSGKAAPGVMVVLAPKHPESNRDLFRRDQSDLDGSFTLRNVIPGFYTIVAIEKGWDLDWAKPAVIATYLQHGQPIVVTEPAKGTLQLPNPVEVQPKL